MAKKNRFYDKAEKLYNKADRLYAKSFDSEYYSRMDNREMLHDQGIIHEDRSAMANMPQKAILRPWGRHERGLDISWEDGGRGAEKQISELTRKLHEIVEKP